MPSGSKTRYTEKQKRKAAHIEEGYLERGLSKKTAAARAWATVNKQDGGGKQPGGSGRKKRRAPKSAATSPSHGRRIAGRSPAEHTRGRSSRHPGERRTASAHAALAPDVYLPTRAEIARRCREIQAGWSPATRRQRDAYREEEFVLTPVHLQLEDAFDRVA